MTDSKLGYSDQEIAQAAEDLKKMAPQELLAMRQYIADLEMQLTLPEAGGSINGIWRGPHGSELMVTQRGVDVLDAWNKMARFASYLDDLGFTPVRKWGDEIPVESTTDASQKKESVVTIGETQPTGNAQSGGSFKAERLVANVSGGRAYWKVQGGQFQQWGVTIWPEVAEKAGINLDDLDPMQIHALPGEWVADFVDNEKGNPQKVTRLYQG